MTQDSLTAQLRLEWEWSNFLQQPLNARKYVKRGAHWIRRLGKALRSPGPGVTERLINIELSHFDLLETGLIKSSEWLLILEDDAGSYDTDDCAVGIAGIMRSEMSAPQYVNISESFTNTELGIEPLLSPVAAISWQGSRPRALLASARPVTNTVCAILYRREFASLVLETMKAIPQEPVIPIDWKLNVALMNLYSRGDLGPGDCWMIDPAPIVQMSMHAMERSPHEEA